MNVDFSGYGENVATFIADSSVKVGSLVKISSNGCVKACADGDNFCGVCLSVRGDYAAVQLSGYAKVTVTSALTLGYSKLVAGKNNTVASGTSGIDRLVIDTSTTEAGILL
jgi:hypothetical protein